MSTTNPTIPRRGRLIVRAHAGLGNRLCGLLSAMVIAELLNAELEAVWPESDVDCFGDFSALFDPVGFTSIRFRPEEPGRIWTDARHVSGAELRRAMEQGETLWLAVNIVFGYDLCEGWQFFEALSSKLRALQPVAAVRAMIEGVPVAAVGLHIRFGDHFPCHAATPRWCYRAALKVLGERYPQQAVFVCSDTPEFVDALLQQGAVPLLTSPAKDFPSLRLRGTLEGSRIALADLWLLSRCHLLLSAPLSSFATTAQSLGGGLAHFISRVPDFRRFRRIQTAWKIHSYIERDLHQQKWVAAKDKTRWIDRAVAFAATRWANHISSSRYQDRPWPRTRRRFEKRFRLFLDSPECQRALEKNPV